MRKQKNPLNQTYPTSLMTTMNQPTPNSEDRFQSAVDLVTDSLCTPDSRLRVEAKKLDCYPELLTVREMVLEYLQELRNNASL